MENIGLLVDFYKNNERQGPGSKEATKTAAGFIDINSDDPKILDIGCGTGRQTLDLADIFQGNITALDYFQDFLDILNNKVSGTPNNGRIQTMQGDMSNMIFLENEFDIIWSEGAIYNMGFENGINQWRKYLKTGGYLAVSELCWLTGNRPESLEEYWMKDYPQIDTISNNIARLEKAGYRPVAHFVLPDNCWIDNYYIPSHKAQKDFLERHNNSYEAKALIDAEIREYEMYQKYKNYYGYVFYISQKI